MGLNFVRRPKREALNSPNDFITVSLGEESLDYAHFGEELNIDFENRQLDRIEKIYKELDFTE